MKAQGLHSPALCPGSFGRSRRDLLMYKTNTENGDSVSNVKHKLYNYDITPITCGCTLYPPITETSTPKIRLLFSIHTSFYLRKVQKRVVFWGKLPLWSSTELARPCWILLKSVGTKNESVSRALFQTWETQILCFRRSSFLAKWPLNSLNHSTSHGKPQKKSSHVHASRADGRQLRRARRRLAGGWRCKALGQGNWWHLENTCIYIYICVYPCI